MPNLASAIRAEIRAELSRAQAHPSGGRLAAEVQKLRAAVAEQGRTIARLERKLGRGVRNAGATGTPWGRKAGSVAAAARAAGLDPKALLAFRKSLGLSRIDFAAKAGVSSGSIFLWESGRAVPRGNSLDKLKKLMAKGSPRGTARR